MDNRLKEKLNRIYELSATEIIITCREAIVTIEALEHDLAHPDMTNGVKMDGSDGSYMPVEMLYYDDRGRIDDHMTCGELCRKHKVKQCMNCPIKKIWNHYAAVTKQEKEKNK